MLDMKVEKKESSYIFDYLLEIIIKIWQFSFGYLWSLANLVHFPMENPLFRLKSCFSCQILVKSHEQKKETLPIL
jgi:hypothetical protein